MGAVTGAGRPVAVSVVVSTRNRCSALALTLEAMTQLEVPPGLTWELIVVDNGSTDGTGALLERFAARLPLRSVSEPVPGLSVARNAGVRAARGAVVAFTDDDCLVDRRWLRTVWEEFARHPELGGVGGRVELHDPRDRPVTIRTSRSRAVVRSAHDLFTTIVGCNMALARRVLDAVGEFDPTLGAGTRVNAGEDLDLLYRALRRGYTLVYVPEMLVRHNHGRRTDAEVGRLVRGYTRGRGALFCKYLVRADRGMAARAYADVAWSAREIVRALRARRPPRAAVHYWDLLGGAASWLAAQVSARRRRRARHPHHARSRRNAD